MFESDDYDHALSQLDFPEESNVIIKETEQTFTSPGTSTNDLNNDKITSSNIEILNKNSGICENDTGKENFSNTMNYSSASNPSKRKILNTHFDHSGKRKFPGPAGLLSGSLEETKDKSISHIELLSQDVDFSPNHLFSDVLETPLWKRLLEDSKSLKGINTINSIKEQGFRGKLHSKKANIVIAVVEAIDRFAADPLITLRDTTGQIKSTLHRDAWKSFSTYIVSQYCAFVLSKPTILTTGNTICKKHYLNITLKNISKIYSSTIDKDKDELLPEGFQRICEDGFTVIAATNASVINNSSNLEDNNLDLLDGLDGAFTDEMF